MAISVAGVTRALKTILRKNSAGSEFARRRLNLIEGSNVTLTVADDAANDEIDVTIAASGSGGGPTGGSATFLVAGSDAPAEIVARADYTCDGTADEVEINTAIDDLPSWGGDIVLAGTFSIAAPIEVNRDCVTLRGLGHGTLGWVDGPVTGGTKITVAASFSGGTAAIRCSLDVVTRALFGIYLRDFTLYGGAGPASIDGIHWQVTWGGIERLFVQYMTGNGLYSTCYDDPGEPGLPAGVDAPFDCFFNFSRFRNNTGHGMQFDEVSTDHLFNGIICDYNGGDGLRFYGSLGTSNGMQVHGCYLYANGGAGLRGGAWAQKIFDTRVQDNGTGGIYLDEETWGGGFQIVGCTLRNNSISADNTYDGIHIEPQAAIDGGTISGCDFYCDAGLLNASLTRERYGINLANSDVQNVTIGPNGYGKKAAASVFGTGYINDSGTNTRILVPEQMKLVDAATIQVGSTTGTKIGTATTQKLGFFNATPVVQPSSTTDLRQALINLGLYATGGASPLNLNGGDARVGRLGIGTAPTVPLEIAATLAGTSGANYGFYSGITVAPASAPAASSLYYAQYLLAYGNSGAVDMANATLRAAVYDVHHVGTTTLARMDAFYGGATVSGAGTATIATGLVGAIWATHADAIITNARGLHITRPQGTTFSGGTKGYTGQVRGIYVETQVPTGSGGATPTTYGLYVEGSADRNYLAGTLAVGSSTFTANSALNLGGHLTFPTDNTHDIGASGATRPRDLFLGRNATIGGTVSLAANGYLLQAGIAGNPGSPAAGDHWYNTTQKAHRFYATAGIQGLVGLIYANTADSTTISGTTSETKFSTQVALTAAGLVVGKVIRVRIQGTVTTDNTASQTLTINVKLGDATNATSGTTVATTRLALTISLTNANWYCEADITIRSATTAWGAGFASVGSTVAAPWTAVPAHVSNGGGVGTVTTIPNISTAHTVHVTATPNDTGQNIIIRNMTVELLD